MAKPTSTKGGTSVPKSAPPVGGGGGSGKGGFGGIHVPEDMGGGDLRVLPEGIASSTVQSLFFGLSAANQPKMTMKHVLTEEMDGNEEGAPPTVGETVLESYSLQPQAMFKLNDAYKAVKGENIPHGDYTRAEFEQLMRDAFIGTEWSLMLEVQTPPGETTPRTVVAKKTLR